jgi:hypothetical protein
MAEDQALPRRKPTHEEVKKARQLGDEWYRPVREVKTLFNEHFKHRYPVDCIYLLHQVDVDYRAYIFFHEDCDIADCEKNGVTQVMRGFVVEKLEEFSRKKGDKITVAFEFDSRENVQKNFGGSYLERIG